MVVTVVLRWLDGLADFTTDLRPLDPQLGRGEPDATPLGQRMDSSRSSHSSS